MIETKGNINEGGPSPPNNHSFQVKNKRIKTITRERGILTEHSVVVETGVINFAIVE